ncbi:MAG: hypothetical protein QOI33_2991 [Mycobacterium sp.]|nr:hypothetical protein [Mycobacterium sp.]
MSKLKIPVGRVAGDEDDGVVRRRCCEVFESVGMRAVAGWNAYLAQLIGDFVQLLNNS